MSNRKAALEVYSYPVNSPGRREASWVLNKEGNVLEKQCLFLTIWGLEDKRTETYLKREHFFYEKEFTDVLDIHNRMSEIAERFNGTWSRRSSAYEDDASFETKQRDELIAYLKNL